MTLMHTDKPIAFFSATKEEQLRLLSPVRWLITREWTNERGCGLATGWDGAFVACAHAELPEVINISFSRHIEEPTTVRWLAEIDGSPLAFGLFRNVGPHALSSFFGQAVESCRRLEFTRGQRILDFTPKAQRQ